MAGPDTAIEPEVDLRAVDDLVADIGRGKEATIPLLQAIQRRFGYLPRAALRRVAERTAITPAQLFGVATFYSQFRRFPAGRHLVSVCHGTACHVAGAERITDAIRRYLGLEGDDDTDAQRVFTVQKVACLGCCSLAPVMRIDDRVFGHLTPDTAPRALEKFLRERGRRSRGGDALSHAAGQPGPDEVEIRIGLGSCCMASGSADVQAALAEEIERFGLRAALKCGGCVGMCHRVPLLEFAGEGERARYGRVTPGAAREILRRHARPRGLFNRLRAAADRAARRLLDDDAWTPPAQFEITPRDDAARAFLGKQRHIVLEGCGEMDPLDLDEYEARGGYAALRLAATERSPEDIIQEISDAGLRGRGGAGFPTGAKWARVRAAEGDQKYVVMNGDEGDPGAFMDRMLMESYPHRVLEGVAIAARAVGADEAWLYVRAEYPLALERLRAAIRQAEERGYLGEGILGSDFSLRVRIMEGAGAFVCGEETGLLASLMGERGIPRFRPPYPAQHGLFGKPTNINNVETYANVPWILRHGAAAFRAIGTERSKGAKVFALAGRIVRGGLIEAPMGVTIGEIVFDIGGGIRDGRQFKAVQIGGPSGGCLPASLSHVRIDFEELARYGAMMGSGGFVVMDDGACMVDMARYFLQFTQSESCGKCTFCRIGTKRMLEILDRLCAGEGKASDLDLLEELADRVKRTSLCGLGQTAPNPVLTTLRYFREEYEEHIAGRCPAKKCAALIRYRITDECMGCTLCSQRCPADAIPLRPYQQHEIDQEKCVRCGTCAAVCPVNAVELE